jgi:hypothetical protein
MPKGKRLNQRERLLLKALAKGATFAEAALSAGYQAKHAKQAGFQAFQGVKRKMPQMLEDKGLTDGSIIDKYLLPALEAMETEFAKFEGRITDQKDVVSWGPRLQALDMLFKLKGSYAPKEITGEGGNPIPVQLITNTNFAEPHE